MENTITAFVPKKNLQELLMNVNYHILHTKFVTSKFRRSVAINIEEPGLCPPTVENKSFVLQNRWDNAFTEEQLISVNPCVQ